MARYFAPRLQRVAKVEQQRRLPAPARGVDHEVLLAGDQFRDLVQAVNGREQVVFTRSTWPGGIEIAAQDGNLPRAVAFLKPKPPIPF